MTDVLDNISEDSNSGKRITLMQIIRIIVLKPTTEIDIVLNQAKYKYSQLFPLLFGIILGVNRAISKTLIYNASILFSTTIIYVLSSILFSFLLCVIYSWVVFFISNSLDGIASFNMTYSLLSYSLIPMILGALLFLTINVILLSSPSLSNTYYLFYNIINISRIIFVFWSMIILILGNAYINSFTMMRSFIASAGLLILLFLIWKFRK